MSGRGPEVVVVGAGIIGASIAYHLARDGAAVRVLDTGDGGGVATPASWAWINASWGNPEPYVRLRRHSIDLWHGLARTLPGLPIRFDGSLTWDMSPAELDRYVPQHTAWGYRVRLVGREEMRAREPALIEMPERAALCEDEGAVEPLEAARLLLEAAVRHGTRFQPRTEVRRLIVRGGRIDGIETGEGVIEMDRVVIAVGSASPGLLAPLGYTLPLQSPEGLLVHSEPLPPVLRGLLITPGLHVRQTVEGRLVGGFDFVGSVVEDPVKAARTMIERMSAMLCTPEPIRYAHTTIGLRPTPADGFPAVGPVPGVGGLFLAATHSGITLAPAIGAMLAREVLTGTADPLLAPYRPDRFATGAP